MPHVIHTDLKQDAFSNDDVFFRASVRPVPRVLGSSPRRLTVPAAAPGATVQFILRKGGGGEGSGQEEQKRHFERRFRPTQQLVAQQWRSRLQSSLKIHWLALTHSCSGPATIENHPRVDFLECAAFSRPSTNGLLFF